jgi:DsbC/DsbD-like thiol-disulfide interchange protein
MRRQRIGAYITAVLFAVSVAAFAQGRPKADVTLVEGADGVHAAGTLPLALRVSLPDGVHIQSNAPRDALLIATVVTATPPPGLSLQDVLYPPAKDFQQAGQSTPLAVFDQHIVIGINVAVAKNVPPGDVPLPLRLRYQACDASTCYAPLREDVVATVHVVPDEVKVTPRHPDIFRALRFRR